ncbi:MULTISPECIES: helix-turn-helix domain-containing protein [unclassified Streptomyces]|uniref:helix-turn-helix domain-containing protein n=1 Tax=unclassified Streptomyces TaxID=2593676 RepID=UPI001661C022|nr:MULTISPECIES: helix-turn-helix domain-containing protein [unclassified Streptomyces]MBD0843813.1 helix-turn-helix domain-containing protein [Streptomyces sp. TRM68416]
MAGREGGIRRAEAKEPDDGAWAQELLDLLRPARRDIGLVVAWLADAVDGTACLQDDEGTLLAGTHTPVDKGLFEDLVGEVAAGRIASAAWEGQGRHLRLVRVEYPGPASAGVLTVSRAEAFDRRSADIVRRTVQVLELLLSARETTTAGHRLERATADLRLAILQLLMVEDIIAARRVAAGLWPGLLDTDSACVYVVESSPEERDRLAEECLDATREQALVVRCPAMDGHVIVVTPRDTVAGELRSLIGRRPRVFLGGSARQRLARTATAYGQAVSALAVAHFRPDNAAVYAERTHPERLMDPAALRAWTDRVLRPLDTLSHPTRAELLATTRLGLEFTAVSAAKVLGVSRNTVRARMDRTEALLGTDFTDLAARAVVHLALNAQEGLEPAPAGAGGPQKDPARLDDLLAGPALQVWARDLLARLDADARPLRRTLRAWIAEGGNAERAAQSLGVHAQTVRDHVRGAEPVLERQLLAGGSDLYEVVLAHLVAGDLDQPVLHRANREHSDSLVHR